MSHETVQIEDDSGESHEYYIELHPAKEGWEMLPQITKIASNCLVPLLSQATQEAIEETDLDDINSVGSGTPDELKEMIEEDVGGGSIDIDPEAIDEALQGVIEEIHNAGNFKLIRKLFRYTQRKKDGTYVDPADDKHFNVIYRGNYGELIKALFHVVKFNFGPALANVLGSPQLT